MFEPTFNFDQSKPSLECPRCGDHWLHQYGVEVFVRHGEDGERGQHVSVDYHSGETTISENTTTDAGNPSGRRDGIRIQFYCEQCDGFPEQAPIELIIEQHKGVEYTYWREDGGAE